MLTEKRWDFQTIPEQEKIDKLAKALNISALNAGLLLQRGINSFNEAKAFFRPKLEDLYNPFEMQDMEAAVNRIEAALEEGETIMVFGDYDVDGTTSVALVSSYLKHYYENIITYIPDRYNEGYGISFAGIDEAEKQNCSLIIALDCGIKALDKVDYANQKNIDFIICDHHRPGDKLPAALAVLDPKRDDCRYPYKELSGCGIGFKLMQALSQKFNWPQDELFNLLDLTAISIACDIVPITGENRILAYYGLKQINDPNYSREGVKHLLKLANKEGNVDISTLVFIIGPRINAAGRIESGLNAVELLTAATKKDVEDFGKLINSQNNERRELDKETTFEALNLIEHSKELKKAKSTVLYQSHWHKGVIGIVASRVIESFYRPTIIFTESNGVAAGSARSVPGFDVYNAIEACSEHILQFGGHKYAAGLTIEIDKIPEFVKAFEKQVSTTITEEQLTPVVEIDYEIELSEINRKFYNILTQMAPFGPENLTPVFCAKNVVDAGYTTKVGSDNSHLKLSVRQIHNPSEEFNGIAFKMGHWEEYLKANNPVDIVFTIEENNWRGQSSLQLMVRDIKKSKN
jgi:single-stranded-DNA-specific exonuclease